MRACLDTSVLVALLTDDPLTARADAFMRATAPLPVVSDFAAAVLATFDDRMAAAARGLGLKVAAA